MPFLKLSPFSYGNPFYFVPKSIFSKIQVKYRASCKLFFQRKKVFRMFLNSCFLTDRSHWNPLKLLCLPGAKLEMKLFYLKCRRKHCWERNLSAFENLWSLSYFLSFPKLNECKVFLKFLDYIWVLRTFSF